VAEVSLCFELGRATVIVNDDQLSLAIGKRGQNVRLAARLTGWDIDILTPPEFQAGTARVDATLKAVGNVSQEQVDKAIALGLIDVRDIEEVGVGPLVEELGLTEEVAEAIVERCAIEAKVVAAEQEHKKAADAVKRAADRAAMAAGNIPGFGAPAEPAASNHADAFANPLLPQNAAAAVKMDDDDAAADANDPDRMVGGMESVPGSAAEIVTHDSKSFATADELSPEEQAVHGVELTTSDGLPDDDADTAAALAEGRTVPPESDDAV
jgi:N utilization substance protein A